MAPATFFDWRGEATDFSVMAASVEGMEFTVTGGGHEAERVGGVAVTPGYFAALGLTPVVGRPLSDSSGPSEVVLSYGYWQRRFGGAASAIGQTLTLENPNDQRPTPRHSYAIVGVMPAGLPDGVDLWTQIYFEPVEANIRDARYLSVYGRLKTGVSTEAGQRQMQTIAGRLARTYPRTNTNWTVRSVPLLDELVGPVRPALTRYLRPPFVCSSSVPLTWRIYFSFEVSPESEKSDYARLLAQGEAV